MLINMGSESCVPHLVLDSNLVFYFNGIYYMYNMTCIISTAEIRYEIETSPDNYVVLFIICSRVIWVIYLIN